MWSRPARHHISMAWCVGVCAIWSRGFLTNSRSHWINRRSVGFCKTWAIGSSRPGPAIMHKILKHRRRSKKLPRPSGGSPRQVATRNTCRNLVARRGAGRPKEQDHTALGKTWNTPIGTQGSTDPLGLYLRRDLPGSWRRCGSGSAQMQHRRHDIASQGNLGDRRSRSSCHRHCRSGRMALHERPRRSR